LSIDYSFVASGQGSGPYKIGAFVRYNPSGVCGSGNLGAWGTEQTVNTIPASNVDFIIEIPAPNSPVKCLIAAPSSAKAGSTIPLSVFQNPRCDKGACYYNPMKVKIKKAVAGAQETDLCEASGFGQGNKTRSCEPSWDTGAKNADGTAKWTEGDYYLSSFYGGHSEDKCITTPKSCDNCCLSDGGYTCTKTVTLKEAESAGGEPVLIKEDVDGNGVVDGRDVTMVLNNYRKRGQKLVGDVNGDGRINALDLSLIISSINR
ncbi:hypothetical protein FJY90_04700, partial [Candidatus Gottesmanbacteria bacterium]|nr:hypothetical protein [Candidatus Gottesmanbacteria bacterium]